MTPKLLMVTRELGSDHRYGLGRSLRPVVAGLRARGWEVKYASQQDMLEADRARRDVWAQRLGALWGLRGHPKRQRMLAAWLERLWMGWWAAGLARREGWDHVHLHDPWLGLGFWMGALRQRLRGVRWGVTEHGFGSYSMATHQDGLVQGPKAQRLFRSIERWTLDRADWVVTPTRLAADQLARDLCLEALPAHWRTIHHPRPAINQQLPPVTREAARLQLGWPDDSLVVLAVGRLVPLKRFDITLAAFIELVKNHPEARLCVLGEGDNTALLRMAEASGVRDAVWMTHTDRIDLYYSAADLYVSTSSTESFGLANLEAMTYGLPCLLTAVGGVPEVAGAGAWLVPCDLTAVSNAMEQLCANPEYRHQWATAGQKTAARWPNENDITEEYVRLYSQTHVNRG